MALLEDSAPTTQPPPTRKWAWARWLGLGVCIGAVSCFALMSWLNPTQSSPATFEPSTAADVLAACQRSIPGSQHALTITVGQVRALRTGLMHEVAPDFASGLAADHVAYYCYKYDAEAKTDGVWATAPTGETVYIFSWADVPADMGTFDPAAAD